jgi:hypothetical protein
MSFPSFDTGNVNFRSNQQSLLKNIEEYEHIQKYQRQFFGTQEIGFRKTFDKENLLEIQSIGQKQLRELKGLPFWIDEVTNEEHEEIRRITHENKGKDLCCFNHAVGLPKKRFKDGIKELPIFDYEMEIFNTMQRNYKNFLRKPRGFGATTGINRYLGWDCINTGFKYVGYKIMYLAGVGGQSFAEEMISRLRNTFMQNYPEFIMSYYHTNDRQVINGVMFEAFPSQAIDSLRGYENVLWLVVDEADYFRGNEEKGLMGAILSYEEKSAGKIILLSTPRFPDGLFYNIEFETVDDYKGWTKLLYDYTWGINKIYDPDFIEREKHKTYFRREYMGKYEGDVGTMFPISWIDAAKELSDMFPIIEPINRRLVHFIGVDPAYRTSKFAITVTRHNKYARYPPSKIPDNYYERIKVTASSDYNVAWNYDMIEVLSLEQHKFPDVLTMVNRCKELYDLYGQTNVYFVVDASAIPFIQALKIELGEDPHYENIDESQWLPSQGFKVIPITYNLKNKTRMMNNVYDLLSLRLVSFSKDIRSLSVGLGSAQGKGFVLNKEQSPENDALESFAQSVYFFKERTQSKRTYYS